MTTRRAKQVSRENGAVTDGGIVTLRMGAGYRDRAEDFAFPEEWDLRVFAHRGGAELTPEQVRGAFERPEGASPIREAARGAKTAAILVDDFRRPTPAEALTLEIVAELRAAGVPAKGISVLLGNGGHRVMSPRECRCRLGAAFDAVGRVVSHDAFSDDVTYCGVTKAGTPVLINRVAAEADFSVSVSTVYPHVLTAWGGGAKMVLPGVAHVSSSRYHHTSHPRGAWGEAPGRNAARRDLEEAAALFGLDVSVCAVMNGEKELCGLKVGEPTKAHRTAVRLARRAYATDLEGFRPDLVVANAYPMDGDPTQTGKAMIPAGQCGAPILLIVDFADPCPWHGVYHGPRRAYLRQPKPEMPPRTAARLAQADTFVYCPQAGAEYVPLDAAWYADSNWDRLISDMKKRFPSPRVAVFPSAPLQMPENI